MSLVEARDLFCVYPGADGGVAALQGLTLDVEEGEICVILGPSGSGKTTLMRVLAGFGARARQHRRRRLAARLALAAPPRRLPGDDARVRRPALLARAGRRADRRGADRGPPRVNLPHPDSPTSPSEPPSTTSNEIPSTACTLPTVRWGSRPCD